jgi:hypothetical protein
MKKSIPVDCREHYNRYPVEPDVILEQTVSMYTGFAGHHYVEYHKSGRGFMRLAYTVRSAVDRKNLEPLVSKKVCKESESIELITYNKDLFLFGFWTHPLKTVKIVP